MFHILIINFNNFIFQIFLLFADMCWKSEGKDFDEKKPCKTDKECESHCVIGYGKCDLGRCWCFLPPSSTDNTPPIIAPNWKLKIKKLNVVMKLSYIDKSYM